MLCYPLSLKTHSLTLPLTQSTTRKGKIWWRKQSREKSLHFTACPVNTKHLYNVEPTSMTWSDVVQMLYNTLFSITTRHTVSNAELFQSDNCYTLFNDNTPHSEQRWTVLIRQLFTRKLVQAVYCFVFSGWFMGNALCYIRLFNPHFCPLHDEAVTPLDLLKLKTLN